MERDSSLVRVRFALVKILRYKATAWLAIVVVGLAFSLGYLVGGVPAAAHWSDLWGSIDHVTTALYLQDHGLLPGFFYWTPVVSESTFILNAVYPTVVLPNLLARVTRDIWLNVKLGQVLQFILSGLTMYGMAQAFSQDRWVSLVAAFAYMYNPILFLLLRGTTQLCWTYALVPLAMLSVYNAFARRRAWQIVVTGILFSIVSLWGHVESIFHEGIPLALFCLLLGLVVHVDKTSLGQALVRTAWLSGVIWAICILFAAFFLLPSLFEPPVFGLRAGHVDDRASLETTRQFSNQALGMFSFQFAETDALPIPEFTTSDTLPVLTAFYLCVSLIGFSGLAYKRTSLAVSVGVLAMVSILLSRGPFSPLPLYQFLNKYVPFFSVSKAPTRYIFFASAPISYLLGCAVGAYGQALARWLTASSRVVVASLGALVILALVAAGTAYNQLDAKGLVAVPDYEPSHPDLDAVWRATREADPGSAYRLLDIAPAYNAPPSYSPLYGIGHRILMNQYELVDRFHSRDSFGRVIGLLNVRYILTAPDWSRYWRLFPEVAQELRRSSSFEPAYRFPAGVILWENKWAAPRSYLTQPALVFGGPGAMAAFYGLSPDYDPARPPYGLIFAGQLAGAGTAAPTLSAPYMGLSLFDAGFEERHLRAEDYDLTVFYNYASLDAIARQEAQYALLPGQAELKDHPWSTVTEHDYNQYLPLMPNTRLLNDSWYHSTVQDQETLSNGVVYAGTAGTLELPFAIAEESECEVFLRLWRVPGTALSLAIDGRPIGVVGGTRAPGFHWVNVGRAELGAGEHQLRVVKRDAEPLYVDLALVVPAERLSHARDRMLGQLQSHSPQLYLYDALWFEREEGIDPSHEFGAGIRLEPGGSATMDVDLLAAGDYAVGVQGSAHDLHLSVDGVPATGPSRMRLDAGGHKLVVENRGEAQAEVQSVWLLSGDRGLPELFAKASGELGWSETSMHSFLYYARAERRALLVNTETYSDAWELRREESRARAVPVNVFSNGFWVPAQETWFEVRYVPSLVRRAGLYLSALPVLVLCACLVGAAVRKRASSGSRVEPTDQAGAGEGTGGNER